MNKCKVVVCGNVNSLRRELSKTARILDPTVRDLIMDRNDCTIRYKIGKDVWSILFLLPHQRERILGIVVHDFYTVGPESNAMFEMTRMLSHRYFITQKRGQSCKPTNKLKFVLTNKSLISSLKKLVSQILKWIRS